MILRFNMIGRAHLCPRKVSSLENKVYTEEDIGTEVRSVIEGVEMYDEVIAVWLPNGKRIIGPCLKCAHIFARFSMIPAMMEVNERMESHMNKMEDLE